MISIHRVNKPDLVVHNLKLHSAWMCRRQFDDVKPASHCPILKSLMALVLTNVIGCDLCLLRSHPIFRSHCPTDRIRFLLYLSHNAFRTMIEMNNRMRSIRSSLACQSPSDSIRFFKIASDCALPLSDFPSDYSIQSVKPSNNLAMERRLKHEVLDFVHI